MTAAPVAAQYAKPDSDTDNANVPKLLEEMVKSGVASGYEKERPDGRRQIESGETLLCF